MYCKKTKGLIKNKLENYFYPSCQEKGSHRLKHSTQSNNKKMTKKVIFITH